MLLYHIDRYGYIQSGQSINLITETNRNTFLTQCCMAQYNGLSFAGLNYLLTPNIFSDEMRLRQTIFEIVFENVRLKTFPDRPSRFQSFYACDEDGISNWVNHFNGYETVDYPIYKIEAPNYFKADAKYISDIVTGLPNTDDNNELSIMQIAHQAHFYWNGHNTTNPLYEYLITPPFYVLERIN